MAEKTIQKKTAASTSKVSKAAPKKGTVKSAKVTPRKTKTVASSSVVKTEKPVMEESQLTTVNRAVRVRKSYVITVIGIIALVVILYLVRNLIIAATVNGQPISRLSVIKELEKQGGKQTLDSLITKNLIIQEAANKHITITQADVDGEMKKIQANLASQGQNLDQVLQLQGMTKDQLTEQIKLQKMIEKMVKSSPITDKEVDDYITTNKESLPQDQDQAVLRKTVKDRLQQQKLNDEAQKFLDTLRKNAKINYYVNY